MSDRRNLEMLSWFSELLMRCFECLSSLGGLWVCVEGRWGVRAADVVRADVVRAGVSDLLCFILIYKIK